MYDNETWQKYQQEQQARRDAEIESEYDSFMEEIIEAQAETSYEITSDLLGDGEATVTQIADMVASLEYEGWDLSVETSGDEVRVYATRTDDDADKTPSRYQNWVMVTGEYGYLTVATKK